MKLLDDGYAFGGGGGSSSPGMSLVATTPAAGIALINGTQNILTYTTPNDGNLHTVILACMIHVTTAQTGGAIELLSTINGAAFTDSFFAGGGTVGLKNNHFNVVCDPNTTVTIKQSTAQTAGVATAFIQLFGE